MSKKAKQKTPSASSGSGESRNGTSIYELALDELKQVATSESHRRKVESSVAHEARGHDDWVLHTTLTAVDKAHENIANAVDTFETETQENFNKTWEAVNEKFDKTWETVNERFDKTWETLAQKFDKTWESVGHNFDATNERTQREISDLRDELTRILDKRFTHIDQTFASIRADIEVVKALQMELIKERIGRPELLKR